MNTPTALQRIVVDTITAPMPGGAKATEAEMVVSTPGRDSLGDRVFPERDSNPCFSLERADCGVTRTR